MRIDALQYRPWTRAAFEGMRDGGLHAVHATVAYHEGPRAALAEVAEWNRRLRDWGDVIRRVRGPEDVRADDRVAVMLGFQTPAPVEADLGLIPAWRDMGVAFMQPTYNQQSLMGSGWAEARDGGLTDFGREAIREMERVGMVVDLSHAGERTALEAAEVATRPLAVTHANPRAWRDTGRNLSDAVIDAVVEGGGVVGFSLYPHHLPEGSATTLEDFCARVAACVRRWGAEAFGIGSDLCAGRPNATVGWMRDGRWRRDRAEAAFPAQPAWFRDDRDWDGIAAGLGAAGLGEREVEGVMGGNWARFLRQALPEAGA